MENAEAGAVRAALNVVPGIPCEGEAPVFAEPWQAQAFAMALALHQRGVFTWTDWATLLGEEIQKARANGDPDDGSTYYRHWLATLERVVALKGIDLDVKAGDIVLFGKWSGTEVKIDDVDIYTSTDITLPSYTDLKLAIGDVQIMNVINTSSSAITVTSPTNTSSVPAQSTKVISLYAYTTSLYRAL